jgi:hypothetical protein
MGVGGRPRVLDHRWLISAEKRHPNERRHRMRLLTASDIEDEDDDKNKDDRRENGGKRHPNGGRKSDALTDCPGIALLRCGLWVSLMGWDEARSFRWSSVLGRNGYLFIGGLGLNPSVLSKTPLPLPQPHTTFVSSHNVCQPNPISEIGLVVF